MTKMKKKKTNSNDYDNDNNNKNDFKEEAGASGGRWYVVPTSANIAYERKRECK